MAKNQTNNIFFTFLNKKKKKYKIPDKEFTITVYKLISLLIDQFILQYDKCWVKWW